MSQTRDDEQNAPDPDGDDRSKAMNDQLRSDVTSWKAARSETAARQSAELGTAVARPPAAKQPSRAKQAKPAAAAAQLADVKKKPFGMSYDGMSQADYITYMISRGAR